MKVLVGDSSGLSLTVALWEDDEPVVETRLSVGRTHSRTFFQTIVQSLQAAGWRVEDLDVLGCVVGPGSFTGLRIAVSGLKALAYAAEKPVYPISSLRALAASLPEGTADWVAPAFDARNRRVFAACYAAGACRQPRDPALLPPQAIEMEAWVESLAAALPAGASLALPGDGYVWVSEAERACLAARGLRVQILPRLPLAPSALVALTLAARAADLPGDPFALLPEYVSPSQAERLAPHAAVPPEGDTADGADAEMGTGTGGGCG